MVLVGPSAVPWMVRGNCLWLPYYSPGGPLIGGTIRSVTGTVSQFDYALHTEIIGGPYFTERNGTHGTRGVVPVIQCTRNVLENPQMRNGN